MNKFLLLGAAALVLVGCHGQKKAPRPQVAAAPVVAQEEISADEQIIQEAASGGGFVINDKYTMPTTAADRKATPDDILYDASGEPYRVVKKLGLKDEQ
ncbi:MAG: hypothetical protein J6333_12295 [Planctomycetes bacterium]|nr:hypothetical protein [Planctomycetota bacterium]